MAKLSRKVRLLALRHLLTAPPSALPERPGALFQVQQALTEAIKRDKGAVLAAIGAPDVMSPILVSLAGVRPVADVLRLVIPSLLAHLGTLPEQVLWDVPVTRLSDGVRMYTFEPPALGLLITPQGLSVRLADGTEQHLGGCVPAAQTHALPGGVRFAAFDLFPLANDDAHPEKSGNQLDLGDRSIEDWTAGLSEAMALVEAGLPTWYAELPSTLQRLVPVGYQPEMHLSASFREAPRMAYLTLHPDPLTLAEAIVHEAQHGKLNTLTWLDPLLRNGRTCWTSSPVRPDLRPLMGVLLAVHAFVPVAAMHHALAKRDWPDAHRFARRRAAVLRSNQAGLDVLVEKAEPTPLGRRLLGELTSLHNALMAAAPPAPPGGEHGQSEDSWAKG